MNSTEPTMLNPPYESSQIGDVDLYSDFCDPGFTRGDKIPSALSKLDINRLVKAEVQDRLPSSRRQ